MKPNPVLAPDPPIPSHVARISPSFYEALLGCPARAAWSAHGERGTLPSHPAALLGISFHGVMEAAQKGEISGTEEECSVAARQLFDALAARLHAEAHSLLRAKFAVPERLPFYHLLRERSAVLASEQCQRQQRPLKESAGRPAEGVRVLSERRFVSLDGLIAGRPDVVDLAKGEVVDYKTGQPSEDGWRVSERESRQLKLYVYLGGQAGLALTRGTIVRGNGELASIDIDPEEGSQEAQRAREALATYNSSLEGSTFADLARPSPVVCRGCSCLPICEPFWETCDSSWREDCGVHVEATVVAIDAAAIQGTEVISLSLQVSRGTIDDRTAALEQVPLTWFTADGDRPPQAGDRIRLVDGRLVDSTAPVVLRADRTVTAVWRVTSEPPR